jgi:imidazolonepropionase-like amidohydrolase
MPNPIHRSTLAKAFALAHFACAPLTLAQDLGVKAPPQAAPITILNATVHTVSGQTHAPGFVTFDRGVITAVGSGSPPKAPPPGSPGVIDATGLHIYPGLIGASTQIGLTEIQAVRATNDTNEVGTFAPEVIAAVAVNPDSTIIPVTRASGILAVASFPTGGLVPGRASVIRLDGWTNDDLTILHDAGLVINWPMMRTITAWWMDTTEEDQLKNIRQSLQRLDDFFDAAQAYAALKNADASTPTDLRFEGLRAVLPKSAPALSSTSNSAGTPPQRDPAQKPVFISAADFDQITASVTWAIERGLRPIIVGGQDAHLCADLLKRQDVPVIITGTHTFPKRDDSPYDDAFTLPLKLQEAGVKWCMATADDTAHERSLPYNAAIAVAYGLSEADAIRGLTLSTAEILGVSRSLGSIDQGKSASIILTTGSPLEVTTRVERAFIDGREIDLSNKQSQLAEKYREKYRQLNLIPPTAK